MKPSELRVYDCPPTLTDNQVLDFCRNGYLILPGAVDRETNERTLEFVDRNTRPEPIEILAEDWFVENVVMNAQACGAVRSLLGPQFHLPIIMSNHIVNCPAPAAGGWHVDGGSQWAPVLNDLQVFYWPQDTYGDLGPTELLPGSHLVRNAQRSMGHLGAIRGAVSSAGPAGTIVITMYRIWHRRGDARGHGFRHLLKYNYWRTAPPRRDWLAEPTFNPAECFLSGPGTQFGEQFHDSYSSAELFCWLCGNASDFQVLGGQSWPLPAPRTDTPYGFPEALAR